MPRRPRPTTSRRSLSLIPALILATLLILIPAASGAHSTRPAAQVRSCKRRYAGNGKKKRRAEERCVRKAHKAAAAKRAQERSTATPGSSASSGSSSAGSAPSTPTPTDETSLPVPPAAPDTIIDSGPPPTVAPTAQEKVSFHATGSSDGYECRIRSAAFAPCSSPWSFEVGKPGEYTGQVRAVGEGGADPTPASFSFSSAEPVERCGKVEEDETWSTADISGVIFSCALEIPAGVKLTIGPGVFVKSEGGGIEVHGTLDAEGTAAEPVTFTSLADDTVGGDTAPDRSDDGSPQAGDWGGIVVSPPAGGDPRPTLDLEHVRVDYATTAVDAQGAVTSITGSTVEGAQATGIEVASPVGAPTVEDNTLRRIGGTAVEVSDASLDLATLDGNSGSAAGLDGVVLNGGDTVAVSASLPWSGNLVPVIDCNDLTVPSGVTLTLRAGTVVKAGDCSGVLAVHGTLDAEGTAAEPVTFTSLADDTVGGDTAPDRSDDGSPQAGDWGGILADTDASVELEYATVDYASTAIDDSAGSSSQVRIDSGSFSANTTAVSVSAAVTSNVQIDDDDFDGNGVAIDASSNWSTLTADPVDCGYVPTMDATGDTFDGSSDPLVSASDYATITGTGLASSFGVAGVKEYPDGWADDVQESSQDTITVHYEPCIDVTEPDDSYVAIAIPLNLTGDPIIPVG